MLHHIFILNAFLETMEKNQTDKKCLKSINWPIDVLMENSFQKSIHLCVHIIYFILVLVCDATYIVECGFNLEQFKHSLYCRVYVYVRSAY